MRRLAALTLPAAALALALAGCAPTPPVATIPAAAATPGLATLTELPWMYQGRTDVGPQGEPIAIVPVRLGYLNERNARQRVPYNGPEAPGTIVVDPYARVLYDVLEGGEAMRFGIAVGREGRGFTGEATIRRKAQWPSWTPTANMVRTEPELYGPVRNGLPGGLQNPLGARALYLYRGGRDTYYRIHGTSDASSIGKATSAGCIRLFNQDIIDLFDETEMGTRVKVRTQAESLRLEGPMVATPDGYLIPAGPPPAAAPAQGTPLAAAAPVSDGIVTRVGF